MSPITVEKAKPTSSIFQVNRYVLQFPVMPLKSFLLGAVLPTLLLGLATVLMKLSMREGSSIANYLVSVGVSVLTVGIAGTAMGSGWVSQARAIFFAASMGLVWAGAIGSMAYAISTLNIPLSILAPLTNANALVAVALSAIIFDELQSLNLLKLISGTVLIVIGAGVVSTARL